MKSSVEAFKLAGGLFIIPIMMAYTDLLNPQASTLEFVFAIVQTAAIILAIAIAIEGFLMQALSKWERIIAIVTVPFILLNPLNLGMVAIGIIVVLVFLQWRRAPQAKVQSQP